MNMNSEIVINWDRVGLLEVGGMVCLLPSDKYSLEGLFWPVGHGDVLRPQLLSMMWGN